MNKWYNNAWKLTLAIIFIYPLGLYGMFKSDFSRESKLRVLIPSLFMILGLGLTSGTKKIEKFHVFEKVQAKENIDHYSTKLFQKHQQLEKAVLVTDNHRAYKLEKNGKDIGVREISITNLSRFVKK